MKFFAVHLHFLLFERSREIENDFCRRVAAQHEADKRVTKQTSTEKPIIHRTVAHVIVHRTVDQASIAKLIVHRAAEETSIEELIILRPPAASTLTVTTALATTLNLPPPPAVVLNATGVQ